MSHLYDTHENQALMQDYRASPHLAGNPENQRALWMFFSPVPIPEGLTDDQILTCIRYFKMAETVVQMWKDDETAQLVSKYARMSPEDFNRARKDWSRVFGVGAYFVNQDTLTEFLAQMRVMLQNPLPLPRELMQNPMTTQSFHVGMQFMYQRLRSLQDSVLGLQG